MAADKIDISYVAQLARLELSPEQRERLQSELGSIVDYIAKLAELDISGVEPTAHAIDRSNVWRDDEVKPSFSREEMLANAPEVTDDGSSIKVPQVLPGEGSN